MATFPVEELGAKAIADWGASRVPESYVLSEEHRMSNNSDCSFGEQIPVIDLSCFSEEGFSKDEQNLVIQQVAQACETFGFFQVVNHGVSDATVSQFFQACHSFFNLAPEEKLKYGPDSKWKHDTGDGYGLFAYGVTFQGTAFKAHDWRDWGKFEMHLANEHDAFPNSSFKKAAVEYEHSVGELFRLVVKILSQGLGLEEDYLLDQFGERHRGFILLNYYPPCPSPELVASLSAHSDPLALTILAQEQVQGLEVLLKDKWIPVKPVPNAFVVNLGDMMQIFTNGKYKSAYHRVRASNRLRMSVASFFGPALQCPVAPIPQLLGDDNPPRYKSSTTAEYTELFYKVKIQGKPCLEYVAI